MKLEIRNNCTKKVQVCRVETHFYNPGDSLDTVVKVIEITPDKNGYQVVVTGDCDYEGNCRLEEENVRIFEENSLIEVDETLYLIKWVNDKLLHELVEIEPTGNHTGNYHVEGDHLYMRNEKDYGEFLIVRSF